MFNPPEFAPRRPIAPVRYQTAPLPVVSEPTLPQLTKPPSEQRLKKKHKHRDPTERDIKHIFSDCEIAHGNARLLSDALAFATAAEVEVEGGVIRVCILWCDTSRTLLILTDVHCRSFTLNALTPRTAWLVRYHGLRLSLRSLDMTDYIHTSRHRPMRPQVRSMRPKPPD